MARIIDDDAVINAVRLKEQAGDPANPAAGYWKVYAKAGGLYYIEDDGTVVGPLGAGSSWADIGARVYNNANININDSSLTKLTFNSERWDTDGIHSIVSNTGRLTCQTTGKYSIVANVRFALNGTGSRVVQILLNNTTIIGGVSIPVSGAGGSFQLTCHTIYNLSVSDYVEVQVWQTSGGALNVEYSANYSPEFMMQKIG